MSLNGEKGKIDKVDHQSLGQDFGLLIFQLSSRYKKEGRMTSMRRWN